MQPRAAGPVDYGLDDAPESGPIALIRGRCCGKASTCPGRASATRKARTCNFGRCAPTSETQPPHSARNCHGRRVPWPLADPPRFPQRSRSVGRRRPWPPPSPGLHQRESLAGDGTEPPRPSVFFAVTSGERFALFRGSYADSSQRCRPSVAHQCGSLERNAHASHPALRRFHNCGLKRLRGQVSWRRHRFVSSRSRLPAPGAWSAPGPHGGGPGVRDPTDQ